jgi:hypothetical protein
MSGLTGWEALSPDGKSIMTRGSKARVLVATVSHTHGVSAHARSQGPAHAGEIDSDSEQGPSGGGYEYQYFSGLQVSKYWRRRSSKSSRHSSHRSHSSSHGGNGGSMRNSTQSDLGSEVVRGALSTGSASVVHAAGGDRYSGLHLPLTPPTHTSAYSHLSYTHTHRTPHTPYTTHTLYTSVLYLQLPHPRAVRFPRGCD